MKSRLFLVALVLVLMLVNIAFRQAANILCTGEFLGLIPYWEMRGSLPCGVFAAAAMVAAMGIGAQFWGGLLPACGAGSWVPERRLSQLATSGLWCGWPLLGCCIGVAGLLFPWAAEGGQGETWFQCSRGLMVQMSASLVLLAGMRMLRGLRRGRAGLPDALVAAAVALSCGLLWWDGRALDFLSLSLVAPLAWALLVAPPEKGRDRVRLAWLLVAALALGTYACGSQYLMGAYLPGAAEGAVVQTSAAVAASLLPPCALAAALLTLALAFVPALRRRAVALRVVAALALLLALTFNWANLASLTLTQFPDSMLTCPAAWVSGAFYALMLALLGGLAWLRHWF